ncbi:MAG: transposase [Roseburia sp.]|nr:transposase [Roseburia sp.]
MPTDSTIIKTIWQYSEPLPQETMAFLRGIASDYGKVKNYVYGKYSGIKSLDSLTPVYGILNEMRYCGLREQLNLPAVYYELAIADAVADIKSGWGILKKRIGTCITANENLSADDRLYLRTVLKLNGVYALILNRQEYEMPRNVAGLDIDTQRLNNLLRRLTRKYLVQPQTGGTDSFRISPNGYSYKEGILRIACRTPRKRVAIPLKDGRSFDRQLRIQINADSVAIAVPIAAKIKRHEDYINTVYAHIGYKDMLTLSNGNIYGENLCDIVTPETERLAKKNQERFRMYAVYEQNAKTGNLKKAGAIEANNLGRRKYDRQKEKEQIRTKDFINAEMNRMIKMEKPERIVIARPVIKKGTRHRSKSVNRWQTRSFYGYVRERLAYKCGVNSIELTEVDPKGTGSICSACGAEGRRQGLSFTCGACGLKTTAARNSAANIEKKYNG